MLPLSSTSHPHLPPTPYPCATAFTTQRKCSENGYRQLSPYIHQITKKRKKEKVRTWGGSNRGFSLIFLLFFIYLFIFVMPLALCCSISLLHHAVLCYQDISVLGSHRQVLAKLVDKRQSQRGEETGNWVRRREAKSTTSFLFQMRTGTPHEHNSNWTILPLLSWLSASLLISLGIFFLFFFFLWPSLYLSLFPLSLALYPSCYAPLFISQSFLSLSLSHFIYSPK